MQMSKNFTNQKDQRPGSDGEDSDEYEDVINVASNQPAIV
jgi:hypothetical protein